MVHQVPDQQDFADVLSGIQPQHSHGAVGVYQAKTLVLPQGLGVHIQDTGGHADDIDPFNFQARWSVLLVGSLGRAGLVPGQRSLLGPQKWELGCVVALSLHPWPWLLEHTYSPFSASKFWLP